MDNTISSQPSFDQFLFFPKHSHFASQHFTSADSNSNPHNRSEKSNEAYAAPLPALVTYPSLALPDDAVTEFNSMSFDETHLIPLTKKRSPVKISPPTFRYVQGLFGEALASYIEHFWRHYGPPYTNEFSLKHNYKPELIECEEPIFHDLISWLPISEFEALIVHPLSNLHRQHLSSTQPVDASRSIFCTIIRFQISLQPFSNVSKPSFKSFSKIVAPSINQVTTTPSTTPLNSRTATRVRLSQVISPIVYLYISFQEGPFEIWQFGPLQPNGNNSFLERDQWSLLHRVSFLTPVQWFDININESMICIIAESSLYYSLLTDINFEPKPIPNSLISGYRIVPDKPLTATWINFRRIALLTKRFIIRLLNWDSKNEWRCDGYIDMERNISGVPPYFKPRIQYNPLLESLYFLLSPDALKVLQIPSEPESVDIEIKPYIIHFPVPTAHLDMPLDILDFQVDTSTGGKYLAVIHKSPPYVRIYLHANVDRSKSQFSLFASLVTSLKPPFDDAIPISISFSPHEAHSHPLLAVLWKQGKLESLEYKDQTSDHIQTSMYVLPPQRVNTTTRHHLPMKRITAFKDPTTEILKETPKRFMMSTHNQLMPLKTVYKKNDPAPYISNFSSPFYTPRDSGEFPEAEQFQSGIFDDPMLGISSSLQLRE